MQFSADGSSVFSNQCGVHEQLGKLLQRHHGQAFRKPIAAHTQQAFDVLAEAIRTESRPLVLDSGCGVGESSWHLSRRFPQAWVIGVDKSAHRLGEARLAAGLPQQVEAIAAGVCRADNCLWVRADLVDFWRLAFAAGWRLSRHYLLYPNPWPKAEHLQRRWHGHGVFPCILALGGQLEARSNWRTYLLELATALDFYQQSHSDVQLFQNENPITPFERKYQQRGEPLYRLQADLSASISANQPLA